MKYKVIPEDFVVNEILDIDSLDKQEDSKTYLYYFLTKKNYTQIKALDTVARIFNTKSKYIHFAGTKDRAGVTTQTIAITKTNRIKNPKTHEDFFNEKIQDMSLEFIGEYPFRLNLGDNWGNEFKVVLRELKKDEIDLLKNKFEDIKVNGVPNYFDSQRFGYAGNSHIVGKYILQNNIELAVYEIVTSLPSHAREEHKEFVQKLKDNWGDVVSGKISLRNEMPKFLKQENEMLRQFEYASNDFSRALRVVSKKIRTLYIGAYQGYLFNRLLKEHFEELPLEVELAHSQLSSSKLEYFYYSKYLEEDGLSFDSFDLPHMRELIPKGDMRNKIIYLKDASADLEEKDDLNEGFYKIGLSFSLSSGAYATNVLRVLEENLL